MSGGGKGGEITVGYRYHLGMHMALCHGPIDQILEIQVDGRVAWEGSSEAGSITVDARDLFGGDKREGGVSGKVDFEFGGPLQGANSYLTSVLPDENPAYRGVACAVLNQCYMGNNPYLKPWAFTAQRVFVSTDGVQQWNPESAGITKGAATVTGVADYVYNLATDDPVLANHEAPFGLNNPDAELIVRDNATGALQSYVWPTDSSSTSAVSSIAKQLDVGDCHPPIERIVRWKGRRPGATLYLRAPPFNGSGAVKMVYMGGNIDPSSNGMTIIRVPVNFSYTRANNSTPQFYRNNAIIIMEPVSTDEGTKIRLRLVAPTFPVTDLVLADLGLNGQAPFRLDEPYEMTAYIANSGPYAVPEVVGSLTFYRIQVPWQYKITIINKEGERLLDVFGSLLPATNSGWFDYGEGSFAGYTYVEELGVHSSQMLVGGDNLDLLHLSGVAEYTPVTLFGDNPPSYFGCGGDCPDMNPAHIIRECLTQPWGLGYQSADIDDTSFAAAATTLLSEGMGMSILWDKEVPIEDFVSEILRHIDAVVYVSRTTGKFVLKLIRNDYDEASLITLDETNARMASDARRPTIGELVTSVTVEFTDVDQDEETGSVTLHNEALIQLQGAVNNATAQYPGFMTRSIASRVAQRDLKALSTPLMSCDIEAGRVAADLNIGDAFKLNFPEQGIYELVMRVESMSVGDGRDNTVKISCVEDAFSVPDFDTVGDTGPGWVNPVGGAPQESEPRLMVEAPYYELVQQVGDREAGLILADDPDAGFLFANGGRLGGELNADLLVDGGSGYVDSGILDFAPYAALALDAWYSDSKLYYTNGKDLDTVTFPARAQVGQEIVRVDSLGVDSNGAFMSVGRGILDTVPAEHPIDSPIVFFAPATDNVQYTASDSVNVKLLTALGSQRLADAPADAVAFNSRAIRPYPPGNLEIDFLSYPTNPEWDGMHSLSWAHRDRLQQTSGEIFDYTDGDIGPEPGVNYVVTGVAFTGDAAKSSLRIGGAYQWVEGDIGLDLGASEFVIEFSIYLDSPIREDNWWVIMSQQDMADDVSDMAWRIVYRRRPIIGAQFIFQFSPNGEAIATAVVNLGAQGNTGLAAGKWHRVRFVRNIHPTLQRLWCYVNGELMGGGVASSVVGTIHPSSEPLRIGNAGNSNYESWDNTQTGANNDVPWRGYIADVRITVGDSRISEVLDFPYIPPPTYPLEFPFPEIVCDSSGVTPCDEYFDSVVTLNRFNGTADSDVIGGNTWTLEGASIANAPASTAELEQVVFLDVNVGTATEYDINYGSDEISSSYTGPPLNTLFVDLIVKSVRDGYDSWQAPKVTLTVPPEIDSIGFDSAGFDSQPDSSPSDPYFANVSLLLHMDGANNSTTFTDSSANNFTMTTNGSPVIGTAQSKFGGASLNLTSAGAALRTPTNAAFSFGTGDFTFEMWAYVPTSINHPGFFDNRVASPAVALVLYDGNAGTAVTPTLFAAGANRISGTINLSLTTWHHLALCRASGVTRLFVDGVQSGSNYADTNNYASTDFVLGQNYVYTAAAVWLDDVRITKGVARYTAAFTPPTAPFLDE